jgi:putative chitinase
MAFDFDFSVEQLHACMPHPQIDQWHEPICQILPEFEINTPPRLAAWLAQMGHESGDLRELQENLNYSAKGLRGVFPKYFPTDEMALHYERKPQMIASRVYGGRMGNGPEETGEGFMYHGRGLIQITGKDNYGNCSMALFGDTRLIDDPDLLCQQDAAIRSACWFWNSRGLNTFADQGDILTITKRINGGTIGLDDRTNRYHRALHVLGLG